MSCGLILNNFERFWMFLNDYEYVWVIFEWRWGRFLIVATHYNSLDFSNVWKFSKFRWATAQNYFNLELTEISGWISYLDISSRMSIFILQATLDTSTFILYIPTLRYSSLIMVTLISTTAVVHSFTSDSKMHFRIFI